MILNNKKLFAKSLTWCRRPWWQQNVAK